MKAILIAMVAVFSVTAVAAGDGFVHIRPGMVKAESRIQMAKNISGELACDLYRVGLEKGALRDSKLMVSQKIGITQVGTYLSGIIKYPEPYSNYQVMFDHAMVAYVDTDEPMLPYLQAFFLVNGVPELNHIGASSDLRFDIGGIEPNSKLILRGSLTATPDTLLTFNCSMRFQ